MRKIINDPVYGFITFDHPFLIQLINHPYYQRLRRIKQMAMAYVVYPGAVHTRLNHSLGAYHLMSLALQELQTKGVSITKEEKLAAQVAILLHDIGHGPFSHALEQSIAEGVHHETISDAIMNDLQNSFGEPVTMAKEIFNDSYPKHFLHQLVSSQLDTDRMDYLTRDSFFTGVIEGNIPYDRLIKMMVVENNQLAIEEKGIYSVEKFLISRRLMYWQVYYHKAVLSAEKMLQLAMKRAKYLQAPCAEPLNSFINGTPSLEKFYALDDADVTVAIKGWQQHPDFVLRTTAQGLVNRKLFQLQYRLHPIGEAETQQQVQQLSKHFNITEADAAWLVISGEVEVAAYDTDPTQQINLLYKNGTILPLTEINNQLITTQNDAPNKKFYICNLRYS